MAPGSSGVSQQQPARLDLPLQEAYHTELGVAYKGKAEQFLQSKEGRKARGKVQLIFTSPPFPLNRKKNYGNAQGAEYVRWLSEFAPNFVELLRPNGSLVIEMGNAWEPGKPVMSTLALEALLAFRKGGNLNLCQQFVCYNPARLPSPAAWVTVERIRLKDAYTHVWWMSPVERPPAFNGRNGVVSPYSLSMEALLKRRTYNSGKRPSQHDIGAKSFLKRHRGAIRPNVLTFTNTTASDPYLAYCRDNGFQKHPARMPIGLADFFIRFLTNKGQLVCDPFAGSNTTGAAAERLGRRWISIEPYQPYVDGSKGWFHLQN